MPYDTRAKPIALWLGAGLFLANGIWMSADPVGWFHAVPGAIDTGSANVHFIRDVGLSYLAVATAFAFAARQASAAFALLVVVTTYLLPHALLHVWEALTGHPKSSLARELIAVFAVALLPLGLAIWVRRPS